MVANRTLGGAKLLDAVRARAASGEVRFRLVVPQTKPSAGLVIYDEAVRESAQVRVDLALSTVAAEGIDGSGEVGDPDPFLATMDAVAERRPDEIIVSTYPATHSGWLRRDLVERIQNASGLPGRAHRHRPRAGGRPVQGDPGGRKQDLQRGGAARAPADEGGARGTPSVHRRGPPAGRQRHGSPGGTRAPGADARPAAHRGPAQLGHDRRPRPVHGHDERARAVHGATTWSSPRSRESARAGCARI